MSTKLKTYEVRMTGDFNYTFEVRARDRQGARDKAMRDCDNSRYDKDVYLNWDYSDIEIEPFNEDEYPPISDIEIEKVVHHLNQKKKMGDIDNE